MPLTVGALARRTALTVRTLHHYDEIGLLKPSGRSEGGYRLYSDADIARLHAIQSLRHLGLPLAEIGSLLDDQQAAPERILTQQIAALDRQIHQASELRGRLSLLRDGVLEGKTPSIDEWVQSLALMTTFGRYFSAGELRSILTAWKSVQEEWEPLKEEVRLCMASGAAHDSERTQLLTRRWMGLMYRWMGGDFSLIDRWGAMYRSEPEAHARNGAPSTEMMAYMQRAIDFKIGLLQQHFGPDQYRRMRLHPDSAWEPLERAGRKLMESGRSPTSKAARELRARWVALVEQSACGHPHLREKLMTMHEGHPMLLVGAPLSREVRAWLATVPEPD